MKARIAFLLSSIVSFYVYSSPPAQDEKLLSSLIKRGVICEGLSYAQQQEALRIYMNQKSQLNQKSQKRKKTHEQVDPKQSDPEQSKACIAPPKK